MFVIVSSSSRETTIHGLLPRAPEPPQMVCHAQHVHCRERARIQVQSAVDGDHPDRLFELSCPFDERTVTGDAEEGLLQLGQPGPEHTALEEIDLDAADPL